MKLYAVGGTQRPRAAQLEEWHSFEQGLVLELDSETGEQTPVLGYVSPPEVVPEGPANTVFKAATLDRGRLYLCAPTEVLVYSIPDFERVGYLTLPCFNDLHHVLPRENGNLLVVSTGLDMLVEVSAEGEALREWGALDEDPWERFSRDEDYRKYETTKPHRAHPNFVCEIGGEIWITRFEQRDAICVTDPGRRIPIDLERAHDGVLLGATLHYTTVNGFLVLADGRTGEISARYDLHAMSGAPPGLGWCRGVLPLDSGQVLVGFSRIRPTKLRDNLRWLESKLRPGGRPASLPTCVTCFDLEREQFLWHTPVEEAGLHAIFSIHAAP